MKYTIVVAEDEPLLLENLIIKVKQSGTNFEVIGSAQTGIQAYELVESLNPDLLITDIRMPVMDGLELIRKTREQHQNTDFIITSGFSEFEYAKAAMKYQVSDYLLKPIDPSELKESLQHLELKYQSEQADLEDVFCNDICNQSPAHIAELLKDYITMHYNEEINLNTIAYNLSYSASYLTKIFCQYCNTSPSKYLISLRIQKAQQLLSHNTELSIRQVGETVGYPEQGYFSRIFKKQTGFSPIEYREGKR